MPVSSPWAPGRGLERHRLHARDGGQRPLQLPEELERALGSLVGDERVQVREARQSGGPLVELRVELHRARAQRVEPGVDREVELGQVDVVPDDIRLVHLGQGRRRDAPGLVRQPGQGVGRRMRDLATASSRAAALEDRRLQARAGDAHRTATGSAGMPASSSASAAANRAISSDVVTSVAQTSRPSTSVGSSGSAVARTSPASTPRRSRRAWTAAASGTRTANSLRYGPGCRRGAPTAARARSSSAALAAPERRDVAQSVRTDRREIDGGGEGEEGLVRADVARRLVASDVLLARAHRHDEGALAVEVGRHPDEPARDLANERIGARRGGRGTDRRTAARCPSGWPSPAAMSAP